MLGATGNRRTPFDRAHRVVLGTSVERLEHVPERIWEGFTRKILLKPQYLRFCSDMVSATENLRTPFDRAHRVVLGTLVGTVGTLS